MDLLRRSTTCIPPPSHNRIRRPHDPLVKPPRRPHLARHKRSAENPHEEPDNVQPRCIRHGAGERGGYGAEEEERDEGEARAEAVACRAGEEPDEEGGG
jgi:hypothetical protein